MRLRDLHRTSGFHVALLFFATFGAASLALFGFLYLETRNYGRNAAYEWVRWESSRLTRLSTTQLRERTDAWEDFEQGGRPLVVFDPKGHRLAGADLPFPASAPIGRPFELKQSVASRPLVYYSMLSRLPDDNLLLVSRSAKVLEALETALVDTFAWGIAGTIGIGLVGAIVFGVGSLRQIAAITSSAEKIMRGDLSGRLPSRGLSADFGHLTSVVNDMLEQLERLMSEVKGVNENIAHDLRTPLTRVMASLERSLRNARTMDDFRTANEDVLAELRQIVVRFSALLRISELEDRVRRAGFAPVDLVRILDDAVEYYEPLAADKGLALVWEKPDREIPIDGDASLLFEAASNLIDNAIKFTPDGGRVLVAATTAPVGFVIADTGCGIPEAELTRVKQRFHRSSKARVHSGFGIGLSLVESIARLHNLEFSLVNDAPGCCASLKNWTALPPRSSG
ncbi:sensor histidine kinase [Methylobacterium haplocladii]|uniref:histidine kinase n=1 Tax=Methylobacterium haplocladii TaxID=1176176 RepID=A0A512INF9_9HYPH|nr:HAMP domain-containing sensor histidine kinase [Methylobacterium haplocladii]GEO99247.1 two-component sensor histidine kinase [Methylobacterium haplocladii]GJD83552.1 Adaptive-response sensory-kinase SasA [Methylobacterium haplocladii]GLS60297.1 two-component sensor histidine kinase [Methylobacterium haplocladii]